MARIDRKLTLAWIALGPRFLPFADVATAEVPLSRLLRLALFQISVGMTLVLLVGTLNRVMIVELGIPASLVAIMVALPLVFAPFRALIGFKSDQHQCELGWRRVPFIWKGTLLQFGGFAIMPFAMLVLAGKGQSADAPVWLGHAGAALAFLLVGAGAHTVQTAGLALATDLAKPELQPRVVGLMYVMLLLGMIVSALAFGAALSDFSPGRLVQVIQGTAVLTLVLNATAMWKQEARHPLRGQRRTGLDPSFVESFGRFCSGENAVRRLAIVGLGTMGFGMADILLEPYGGQILQMTVATTTRLTALLALGGLLGFGYASYALGRGGDAYRLAGAGASIGIPAFGLVVCAATFGAPWMFLAGNFLIGFGGALFGHGTLTATMRRAPAAQVGLALGAWGAVQATAAGIATASSGALRDSVNAVTSSIDHTATAAAGYLAVYGVELALLAITVAATLPLVGTVAKARPERPTPRAESPPGTDAAAVPERGKSAT